MGASGFLCLLSQRCHIETMETPLGPATVFRAQQFVLCQTASPSLKTSKYCGGLAVNGKGFSLSVKGGTHICLRKNPSPAPSPYRLMIHNNDQCLLCEDRRNVCMVVTRNPDVPCKGPPAQCLDCRVTDPSCRCHCRCPNSNESRYVAR